MRKILIFNLLFLIFRQAGYTQSFSVKTGTDLYYRLQSEGKAGNFKLKTSGVWHFTVTSSTDSSLVIRCTLLGYSSESFNQPFNTADSLLCRPNNSKDVEMLCFLNRPFSYVLQKNGNTGQPAIGEIFEKWIATWQLVDGYAATLRQNAPYYLATEMRMIFLQDSSQAVTGNEIHITRLEPAEIKDHPLSEDFITAIVKASGTSRALFEGPTYDSAKVEGYFKQYDPLYGHLNFYKLIKLDLLLGSNAMDKYDRYNEALLQTDDSLLAPSPSHLFNKAQTVMNISVDSAYQTLRYFSKHKNNFHDWMQQCFAQEFMHQTEGPIEELQAEWRKDGTPEEKIAKYTQQVLNSRIISKKLLEKLAYDNDTVMRDEVHPLYLWVEAKKHASNTDSVLQIAGELANLNGDKKYGNTYRYSLLVYKQLAASGKGREATRLLDQAIGAMERSVGDSMNFEREADRNMLAYAYKLKSEEVTSTDSIAYSGYLAKAAFYSPQIQQQKAYASFYDRVFLDSKESYRAEFAENLIKQGNSKEGMRMLSQQLNTDPTILGEMQQAFAQNYGHLDFYDFFNNIVVRSWKTAPDFSLRSPDGKTVRRLEDYRGKWLLIDFWGTWCGPCREEMPVIDAFVKKIKDRKDLAFLSVACRDRPEPVMKYLDSKHYQLPVVMSDNNVEKTYEVTGYPGKFLISPSGNVLPIAFGQDWEKAVEQMASLQPTKKTASKLLKQQVK